MEKVLTCRKGLHAFSYKQNLMLINKFFYKLVNEFGGKDYKKFINP